MKRFFRAIGSYVAAQLMRQRPVRVQAPAINQQLQRILWNQYVTAKSAGTPLFASLSGAGFRCYSQFEEDGIILYLLAIVGVKSRVVVEMCCGSGNECMAANLIINHGFKGHLFDGAPHRVARARRFFSSHQECALEPPEITCAWIDRDNVNELLRSSGVQGEVDVLSLDLDGNDFFIWQAIESISPRICVFETHDIIPSELSVTVPYDAHRDAASLKGPGHDFRSVSLAAMAKLSQQKGYTLVGSHRHGFNVFFLRNDLVGPWTPAVSVESVHDNDWTRHGRSERWPKVKDLPWESV